MSCIPPNGVLISSYSLVTLGGAEFAGSRRRICGFVPAEFAGSYTPPIPSGWQSYDVTRSQSQLYHVCGRLVTLTLCD